MKYERLLTAPLLDRFDIFCTLLPVSAELLTGQAQSSRNNFDWLSAVRHCRQRQQHRYDQPRLNGSLQGDEVNTYAPIDRDSRRLLERAASQKYVSARGIHKMIKLALTIADFEGEDLIKVNHVREALQYRWRPN